MNIIIVGPANPYRGGIAKFNEILAQRLIYAGHQVEIVTFTLQYPSIFFPGKTQYTDVVAPQDLTITRLLNSVSPLSWFKTSKYIISKEPDLVILRYWMPFMALCLGSIAKRLRRQKIRTVALTDNILPHEPHPFSNTLTKYFLNNIDKVVYMSAQVGKELDFMGFKGCRAFSPHPIYDNYGDVVTRSEACDILGLDIDKKTVLFFGFIRDYKGLDLLLRAWAELPNRHDKQLLVAGEFYANKDEYLKLINSLGIKKDVIIHDSYIPEDKVRHYFSASELVVQPYRNATQSGVTQIAYNFAVPMIVTNVGGLAEIVKDGKVGYVVEVDPTDIARAINMFFEDNKYEEFHQNIQYEKERFSWNSMIESILPGCEE